MSQRSLKHVLGSYIESLHPIIYIQNFDFNLVDSAIEQAVGSQTRIIEFSNALGAVNFKTKNAELSEPQGLYEFLYLNRDEGFGFDDEHENLNGSILLLKDVHNQLSDPRIIAFLRDIAEKTLHNPNYRCTVIIVSEVVYIPKEIEAYVTVVDVPLPGRKAIMAQVRDFIALMDLTVPEDLVSDLALSLKGLNEHQIQQVLRLAYQDGGMITTSDKKLILREKEQFIKKSGMLYLINVKENIDEIGGLAVLKRWLSTKAKIFSRLDRAIKFGVQVPKGVMIVGMPGCGKSLTAKVSARMFGIPLVRLDVGRLMGKYVGESENNMRRALKLAEAISPCVLWIDEIEKAFSGIGSGNGGGEVTTRLFGQMLTWMQEKENTVFIVATANDISALPPEFMRKGRFDEVFFVDLPDESERRMILDIHLKKRRKWQKRLDTADLATKTKGFNGADLEAVVNSSIEKAFIEDERALTKEDLLNTIKVTESVSAMLGPKIDECRKKVSELKIKNASKKPDNKSKKDKDN